MFKMLIEKILFSTAVYLIVSMFQFPCMAVCTKSSLSASALASNQELTIKVETGADILATRKIPAFSIKNHLTQNGRNSDLIVKNHQGEYIFQSDISFKSDDDCIIYNFEDKINKLCEDILRLNYFEDIRNQAKLKNEHIILSTAYNKKIMQIKDNQIVAQVCRIIPSYLFCAHGSDSNFEYEPISHQKTTVLFNPLKSYHKPLVSRSRYKS